LYANVFNPNATEEQEIRVSKIATASLAVLAIILGIQFQTSNVAFLVGLAFTVAASATFPVLIMSMYYRNMTTKGAICGGTLGLVSAIALIVLGPGVWKTVLGNAEAIFPYSNPALFTMTLAFAAIYLRSKFDNSEQAQAERALFDAQFVRAQTGIGAEGASAH
jgi:cation/acetate symporter